MNTIRRTATIVGVLFIIGTVSGILSSIVTGSIFDDPDYLIRVSENETQVALGASLVLLMGFSLAMVPVMLFPIFKKHNEALALGAVVFRGPLEAFVYILIVMSWLVLITVSHEFITAGAPAGSHFENIGNVLLKSGDQLNQILEIVFSLGALMIYTLFYQTRLIPTWLSLWGLIGAVIYFAAGLLHLFGFNLGFLLIPLGLQEMVQAVWLIVKGFDSNAID